MIEGIILWILAFGAVLGGIDFLLGDRFQLGGRFEEGFRLLGPTALSMSGILCLAPLLSRCLEYTAAPSFSALGFDPAMLAGMLALDMGGYQMASALAEDPLLVGYAGILCGATLGCTVSFTIPLGLGLLEGESKTDLLRGLLIGMTALPVGLVCGGLLMGLSLFTLVWQTLPILILAALVILGLRFAPKQTLKGFNVFADLIRILSIIGLILGVVTYLTGVELVKGLTPIEEAMKVISGIGLVMLGSLPAAELLRRLLSRPLQALGQKLGMNDASLTALLVGFVSVTPAVAMLPDMDRRGRVVNAAYLVCAASALAAHLGFTISADGSMLVPLLVTKAVGGITGAVLAVLLTNKE